MATALRFLSQWALLLVVTTIWLLSLAASGWTPYDVGSWWMEVAPVLIALPLPWLSANRLPLTGLALI